MIHKQAYATPTAKIMQKMELTDNVVTKASYRQIIGNRIDRLEMWRLSTLKEKEGE